MSITAPKSLAVEAPRLGTNVLLETKKLLDHWPDKDVCN